MPPLLLLPLLPDELLLLLLLLEGSKLLDWVLLFELFEEPELLDGVNNFLTKLPTPVPLFAGGFVNVLTGAIFLAPAFGLPSFIFELFRVAGGMYVPKLYLLGAM